MFRGSSKIQSAAQYLAVTCGFTVLPSWRCLQESRGTGSPSSLRSVVGARARGLGRGQERQQEVSHFSSQLPNLFITNIFQVKMSVWESHYKQWPGFGWSLTAGALALCCPARLPLLQSKLKGRPWFFTSVPDLQLFDEKLTA